MIKIDAKTLFKLISISLIIADLNILVSIPIISPIFIFLFLVQIPGMIIIYILKMRLSRIKLFVISFGLSISFLIITGLIINYILPIFGILNPLQKYPLTISFNMILIALILIAYDRNKKNVFSFNFHLDIQRIEKIDLYFLLYISTLPFLMISGVKLMNYTDNNIILTLLPYLITIYLIFVILLSKKISNIVYPISILLIGLSLALVIPLRAKFLILGGDGDAEFYFFKITSEIFRWTIIHDPINSSLGGGLLHTIFYSLLGIEKVDIFKLIYPTIFSITPIALFILFDKYMSSLHSFLASIFFIVQYSYIYVGIGSVRMAMSLFFFAFAMMILFDDDISLFNKRLLFLLFGSSVIFTYYAFSYMFIILNTITWILVGIFNRLKINTLKNTILTKKSILFILVVIFLWYGQITDSHFVNLINFFQNSIKSMADFNKISSRGELAEKAAGTNLNGPAELINLGVYYVTVLLIFVGSINIIIKKYRFELEYRIMVIICIFFWLLTMGVPYFSSGSIGILRVFYFTTILLSPIFIFGACTINQIFSIETIHKLKFFFINNFKIKGNFHNMEKKNFSLTTIIVLSIIALQLFVNVGITYQIFGDDRSIILNSKGLQYDIWDISKQEVMGSKWLQDHNNHNFTIFGDFYMGSHISPFKEDEKMNYYGLLFKNNWTIKTGYIFLRSQNIRSGMVIPYLVRKSNAEYAPLKNYDNLFVDKGKIYDSGETKIFG